jgi:hypothetical protein
MERSLYELNGVEFAVPKTPTKWRTKIGRSFLYIYTIYFCIVSRSFIRLHSPLASQPARNSIRRVTNLPEGKWIEASFLKEVRSRVSVKYYYLQWNCWVSPFFCRWVGIVERFFFYFFHAKNIISNTTTRKNAISRFYTFCIGICWWANNTFSFVF